MSDQCSSCKAEIKWLRTERGHLMPVNAETVGVDDKIFKPGIHVSHFATCPNSDEHRKKKEAK